MFKQLPKIFRKFAKDTMVSAIMSGSGSFGFALSDKKSIIFNAFKLDQEDGYDNWLSITDVENGITIKLTYGEMVALSNALMDIVDLHDGYYNEGLKK